MKIGYARVSTADQNLDLQLDALTGAGVPANYIYSDHASGASTARPGLEQCLRALREGDCLVVWKLDRLGRSLKDLVGLVETLRERGVGFQVLTGAGMIDTTTPAGRMMYGFFAVMAEYERELIRERTLAGLKAARARGRKGGRPRALTKHQVSYLRHAMGDPATDVAMLLKEMNLSRASLYRYVSPSGELREMGKRVMGVDS